MVIKEIAKGRLIQDRIWGGQVDGMVAGWCVAVRGGKESRASPELLP